MENRLAVPAVNSLSQRKAIGLRFGERIAAGAAVFQRSLGEVRGLPFTVTEGMSKAVSGPNMFVLLQVMKDRGLTDPRFFTSNQIKKAGWKIVDGSGWVGLQYLATTDADGVPLEVPEAKRVRVFNAVDIIGVPALEHEMQPGFSDVKKALNAVGYEGLEIRDWLSGLQQTEVRRDGLLEHDMTLRMTLALTLLEAQTEFIYDGIKDELNADDVLWARKIESDPLSFFSAVRDAEKLAAVVMREVRFAMQERISVEMMAANALLDAGVTPGNDETGAVFSKRIEQMFAEREAVLAVPFADKDKVKALGAMWFNPQKMWFVPKGIDTAIFNEWNPRSHAMGAVATRDVLIDSFMDVMASLGLDTSGDIKDDGVWHHVSVDTKKGNHKPGSYILSMNGGRNGEPCGHIINRYTGESVAWRHEGELLTPEQRARMRADVLAREAAMAAEVLVVQDAAAIHANEIWAGAVSADNHGYVVKKEISPEGLRQTPGEVLLKYAEFCGQDGKSTIRSKELYLIVPMINTAGEVRAVQAISEDGRVKSFMRGAQKKGLMHVIGSDSFDALVSVGSEKAEASIAYSEGVATGASFRAVSGLPVVVCFDAGNMETVVAQTAGIRPDIRRVLAIDNDQFYVERALGFLAENIGVSPVAEDGQKVCVVSGKSDGRQVDLGEAVADGQWHTVAKGSYCLTLGMTHDVESGSEKVRSVTVELLPVGGRKLKSVFSNRGVEAGEVALASIVKASGVADVVIPVFASLKGKPTDWNDLVVIEGVEAASKLMLDFGFAQNVSPERLSGVNGLSSGSRQGRGIKESVAR